MLSRFGRALFHVIVMGGVCLGGFVIAHSTGWYSFVQVAIGLIVAAVVLSLAWSNTKALR
jgi:hypothetical protein